MSSITPYNYQSALFNYTNLINYSNHGEEYFSLINDPLNSTPLPENKTTIVLEKALSSSEDSYAMFKLADPLANIKSISIHRQDRDKIFKSMDATFNTTLKRLKEQAEFSFPESDAKKIKLNIISDESKINTSNFISRLRNIYPLLETSGSMTNFFKSKNLDDQKSILDWIALFRFNNHVFLIEMLNFLVVNPSQFDYFKLVLNSAKSSQNKIDLINKAVRDHYIKYSNGNHFNSRNRAFK